MSLIFLMDNNKYRQASPANSDKFFISFDEKLIDNKSRSCSGTVKKRFISEHHVGVRVA